MNMTKLKTGDVLGVLLWSKRVRLLALLSLGSTTPRDLKILYMMKVERCISYGSICMNLKYMVEDGWATYESFEDDAGEPFRVYTMTPLGRYALEQADINYRKWVAIKPHVIKLLIWASISIGAALFAIWIHP